MNVKSHFSDLKSTLRERNSKITKDLENYRNEAARIRSRYVEDVATEELGKLEAATRSKILDADTTAHDSADRTVEKLRKELSNYIGGTIDPGLLAQLQTAQSFGLSLTRSEISVLAEKSNGNPVALAALAQMSEKCGFHLKYTTAADLEHDLKKALSLFNVPSLYTPSGYTEEALRCAPDEVRYGVSRRPDIVSLTARMKSNETAPGQLDEMCSRWSSAEAVEIVAFTVV